MPQQIGRRGSVLLASGLAAGVGVHGGPAMAQPVQAGRRSSIVGTWALTVQFEDGLQNPTLISFDQSGTVVETNALTRSTGLGEWSRISGAHFRYVFWEQIFNAENQLESHVRVSHDLKLSRSGQHYQGDGIGEIFDLDWRPVVTVRTAIWARRLS